MKKILFLIHTLGVGGAERVLVNLANELAKSGYDITVMTVIDTGVFKEELSDLIHYKYIYRIPFLKYSTGESGSLQSKPSKLKNILKSLYQMFWRYANCGRIYRKHIAECYDYEIAFLEGICAKIISQSTNEKSHKFAWIHIDILNESKSDKFFCSLEEQKSCYDHFQKIVCVSEYVRQQAFKKLGIEPSKFVTLYNPLNTEKIEKEAETESVEKSKKFTFCSVGRLAKQKGYDRLIEASALLKGKYDFNVQIIGEGPAKEQLEQMITKYHLEEVVSLLGYKENPYPYIKTADVFICSSRAEGFSTVASEAVILEKPCIVTDCSGMRELFGKDGEFGYIVENSVEGIYRGMDAVLTNRDLLRYYTEKSRVNRKRFNISETIKKFKKEILDENQD